MSNSFKSLLSDQVIALEWGTALKDVLCLFFWKCITLNGFFFILIFIWHFIFFAEGSFDNLFFKLVNLVYDKRPLADQVCKVGTF